VIPGPRFSRSRPAGPLAIGLALCCLAAALVPGPASARKRSSARARPPSDLLAVTLNLWHDQRDWPARRAVILDSLRALRPDVIFLQEVLEKEGLPNQAQALAESLGCAFFFASVDTPGAPKRYGNAILTRHRIAATHEVRLEPFDDYRVAAHARLDVDGRSLDTYVTHLHHTDEGDTIRATQVWHLIAFVDRTRGRGALVLGGDFNAAPDAPELEPLHARLSDTYALLHPQPADPPVTTLNPAMGHSPQRIDYLFCAPGRLRPVASEIFLDTPTPRGVWASDHFGVWTRFGWPS
jgi:beta-glucosidase